MIVPAPPDATQTPADIRAVTPDGRWMAVQRGQWERATIGVLDAVQGNEIAQFPASAGQVAFSANGDWVSNIAYPNASVVVRRSATAENTR